ncbi:putative endonuclease lcl3 [Orbilia oligospora]|uniref:Probable endonuclease LCL3 n=1 Tax=Orbilia oligospora TaxID=2813651 RepID=A0A7C8U3Q3_ORBOL|nr:putative endonuclease lcl3 [Orbilia oligospora]KAF3214011.1 putative endonuclease lcl3 [Orbilia oligospora]KAF3220281.1 putative endonuclease lcl3 [Orbilia oligospora]
MPSWISPPPPPPEHPLIRSYNSLKARISGITSLPPSAIDILLPSITAATATLTLVYLYRNFLKRYPDSNSLPPQFFRRKGLYGKVVSVGDADNFRLFHTPGGRWTGWGWLRRIPEGRKMLKGQTIHIRIAGVDAPEGAHFGKPSQPHSSESLSYLSNLLTSHNVRAHLLRRDQYERVVCSVSMKRKGILGLLGFKHDVGLLMLKAGMAQVYEGTYGIEFGKRQGMEEKYRAAEEEARAKKLGIWGLKGKYESPGQYKARFGGKEGPFTPSTAIADKGKESTGEKVKGKRGVSSSSAAVKLKVETRGRKRKAPSAATATTVAKVVKRRKSDKGDK